MISGCGASEQYWQSPFVVDLLKRQMEAAFRRDTDGYIEMFLRLWVDGPYRFEVLEGVSHWIPEEAADRLNALLVEHLAHTPGA